MKTLLTSLLLSVALIGSALAGCKVGEDKKTYRQTITELSGAAKFTEVVGDDADKLYDLMQPKIAGMPQREGHVEIDAYNLGEAVGIQVYKDGCQAGGIILPVQKFIDIVGQVASGS